VTRYVEERREVFGVEPICRVLGVPVSTHYARRSRKPSRRELADLELLVEIEAARSGYRRAYGARKTWKELRRRGVEAGRDQVARVMRQHGIEGKLRGGKKRTTIADEAAVERARDLLQRDFAAAAPNEKWVCDLTYIRTWHGFVYLAFVLDCYSRMIVGWQLATHMRTELVLDALEMGNGLRRPSEGLIAPATRSARASHEPPADACHHPPRTTSITRCCDHHLNPPNTPASATPTGSTRSAPRPRSAREATPTTTRWPRPGSRPSRASS
jgi:transposase InsO family protein